MFKSSFERFKKISQRISAILEICASGTDAALGDEIIRQPAIMMHFINIYELVKGIQNTNDIEALLCFKGDEIKALSATRNIASHEYEKLNLALIKMAIEDVLPNIKERIDKAIMAFDENSR